MKNIFNIVATLVYIHSSVSAYYFNDEKNKLGYILVDNGVKNHPRYAYQRNQRKQFAVNHHYSENIVDSHFKTETMPYHVQPQQAKSESQEIQNTKVNKTQIAKGLTELKEKKLEKQVAELKEKNLEKEQFKQQISQSDLAATKLPKRSYPLINPGARHDTKQSYLSMNINKALISTNPQKYRRLNNHPLTMSYHRQDYQRIPTSSLVDKNFQQMSGGNNNFQTMSRVLDDMTRNISDRRSRGEYRKREAGYSSTDKTKNNIINDTIKKYLIGKDKNLNTERRNIRTKEYARIGSQEEIMDPNENPYAIFYRMHPDTQTLEDQTYIPMAPTERVIVSNKNKRLSMNYDNNTKKTKFNSSLKMHKNVKNYHFTAFD